MSSEKQGIQEHLRGLPHGLERMSDRLRQPLLGYREAHLGRGPGWLLQRHEPVVNAGFPLLFNGPGHSRSSPSSGLPPSRRGTTSDPATTRQQKRASSASAQRHRRHGQSRISP